MDCFQEALEILYEDDVLLAVHKPAGLLMHPSWIASSQQVTNMMSLLKRMRPGVTLHTLHRLDRATSGVVLVAKDDLKAAKIMHQQFLDQRVKKTYCCIVRGWPDESGVIDYALSYKKDHYADPKAQEFKPAQPAVTHYKTVARTQLPIAVGRYPQARYALVEVKPASGRKHQIRRHMKHIAHPILGDTKHGDGRHNQVFRECYACHRLLLMATEIECMHPVYFEKIHIKAPLEKDVRNLMSALNLDYPSA